MAISDDHLASRFLLTAVTTAITLALIVSLAGEHITAAGPADQAAWTPAQLDRSTAELDGHGITASIVAAQSSTVAAFVRTWDGRARHGNAFDTADNQTPEPQSTRVVPPEPSPTPGNDTEATISCISFRGLRAFCNHVAPWPTAHGSTFRAGTGSGTRICLPAAGGYDIRLWRTALRAGISRLRST